MTEVILYETPLTDEVTRDLVRRLELPHVTDFSTWSSPPDRLEERYFPTFGPLYRWHKGVDHWLQLARAGDVIRHCEIIGLDGEREAKLLRQHARRMVQTLGRSLLIDEIRALADELTEQRKSRRQAETFEGALRKIRSNFLSDGSLSEKGYFVPLAKLDLPEADVELLRQVFLRLPEAIYDQSRQNPPDLRLHSAPCPTCGGSDHRRDKPLRPGNERKATRQAISHDGFGQWFKARLTDFDALGVWQRARALYDDYSTWTQDRHADRTRADHTETAAAVMSFTAWGLCMVRVVQRRRDGSGNLYNVRLKRR